MGAVEMGQQLGPGGGGGPRCQGIRALMEPHFVGCLTEVPFSEGTWRAKPIFHTHICCKYKLSFKSSAL